MLIDTQTMSLEMGDISNFYENMLCDYLAEKCYKSYFMPNDALIVKPLK